MLNESDYYSPREVAEMLEVSRMTVFRLIARNELDHIRISERIIRIPKVSFEAYCRVRMIRTPS